ncbi:hypothetical protein EDC39_112122 [Geothermobacter ehrlichii]|uniref:Uncharacterized protein n=1 Tax=Geothermobacter ehrlichii TaxID=213224 RepID=A0A5D3WJS0_9BACT|nr:hypothetical protein [Geothermobacter ehrlichii]TYO96834.1 hypothetical protein EDC39_112122 [Geothermobacter ehrlichii]
MQQFKFKGWVPNTSGAISFSLFGESSCPSPTIRWHRADADFRYIICAQKRQLLDSAIPFFKRTLNRILYKQSGEFYFLCLANGNGEIPKDGGRINGYVLIFDIRQWPSCLGRLKQYTSYLSDFDIDSKQTLNSYFHDKFDKCLADVAPLAYAMAQFTLERNGITEILVSSPYPSPTFHPAPIVETDDRERHIAGHNQIYKIASQCFIFIKDISHYHQNHTKSTDSIVKLHPVKDEHSNDWKLLTIKELYSQTIEFKRDPSDKVCANASGIIPYVKCFLDIVGQIDNLPKLKLDYLKESLDANHRKVQANESKSFNYQQFFLTVWLSIVGIIFSVTSFLEILPETNKSYIVYKYPAFFRLAVDIIANPIKTFSWVTALIIIFSLLSGIYRQPIFYYLLSKYRDIQRIFICLPLLFNIVTQLCFGVAVFIIYFFIIK